MTTNLLKRLESSVESFRLTLGTLSKNIKKMLKIIEQFKQSGTDLFVRDTSDSMENMEYEDDDRSGLGEFLIGGKVQVSLTDMGLNDFRMDLLGYV